MTAAAQALQAEFDSIDKYLNAVRETLREGHMPDMVGLDARVSHLCAAIEKSEQDVQHQCLPKLNDLLRHIDECEAEIRAFHQAMLKAVQ